MQDRRRRTALRLPPPAGPVLLPRERQSSSTGPSGSSRSSGDPGSAGSTGSSGPGGSPDAGGSPDSPDSSGPGGSPGASGSGGSSDDNPFAPPPEGRPDQPWRPRRPEHGDSPDGASGRGGWGSQWSSRQPGRSSGGFGSRPGGQSDENGQGGGQEGPDGGRGGGLRWDPTDPVQRRARYALLSGMWAFFFALFDFPEIGLLLGALALYWGISSLRDKPGKPGKQPSGQEEAASGAPASVAALTGQRNTAPGSGPASKRQQRTAAVSGLVTACLALAIVAATFSVQLAYRDYYTCVNDSLTKTGQLSCNDLLPRSLVPVFGVKE
ncbi:hypothetical protein [Streptomyces sp. AK02-01A]|uniref:hypothetical protein n=1 Tax=Streptomyces sp. AK02-01A TaxID=3028648 RepID=UPI0029AE6332|nr:hypothetical protein [Streptomyces sp. AK02-01A]MDX3852238.1 hypothetical protein [Streptomyces sp. AK02-01A]